MLREGRDMGKHGANWVVILNKGINRFWINLDNVVAIQSAEGKYVIHMSNSLVFHVTELPEELTKSRELKGSKE
jgi:hypothetical protein